MYIPKYFQPHELVYPELFFTYEKKNQTNSLWLSIDERVLITLDCLRERFGTCYVNNYYWGGNRKESGLRNMSTSTGATLSQHKFGRACDVVFKNITAEEVRQEMKKLRCFDKDMRNETDSKYLPFKYINAIEWHQNGNPISWFHFDVRNDRGTNNAIKWFNV